MIIGNRYPSLRFSTDSIAHDVRQFVEAGASRMLPAVERLAAPLTSYTFDDLYPSLAVVVVQRLKTVAIAPTCGADRIRANAIARVRVRPLPLSR